MFLCGGSSCRRTFALFLNSSFMQHSSMVTLCMHVVQNGISCMNNWLILELCPLGNLAKYAESTNLNMDKKIAIMIQCTCAVCHLHHCKPRSFTRRDIKPQNILVSGSSA